VTVAVSCATAVSSSSRPANDRRKAAHHLKEAAVIVFAVHRVAWRRAATSSI
jgi:hypothetical protein